MSGRLDRVDHLFRCALFPSLRKTFNAFATLRRERPLTRRSFCCTRLYL